MIVITEIKDNNNSENKNKKREEESNNDMSKYSSNKSNEKKKKEADDNEVWYQKKEIREMFKTLNRTGNRAQDNSDQSGGNIRCENLGHPRRTPVS